MNWHCPVPAREQPHCTSATPVPLKENRAESEESTGDLKLH